MLASVKTDGHVLRQNFVFCFLRRSVSSVDLARHAPSGRAVFLAFSVVSVVGKIDSDSQPVAQKQNEDSFYAVLTKLYVERILHHCSEIGYQSGNAVLHYRRYQKRDPYNRNYTAEIQNYILPG